MFKPSEGNSGQMQWARINILRCHSHGAVKRGSEIEDIKDGGRGGRGAVPENSCNLRVSSV